MKEQEIIKELEEMLRIEDFRLEPSTKLDEINEWDSMSKLSFISYARKQFGKRVTFAKLTEYDEVKDICAFLMED